MARFSIIVPSPTVTPEPAVLGDLVKLALPEAEIFVAVGANPSRQRNLAVAQASGEVLVFLDSDCRVDRAYFERVDAHMREGRNLVGGPVLLEQPAPRLGHLFQNLLGHRLLTGAISARYRSCGVLRVSDDCELILCNTAVRRSVFTDSGGFDERLYPNEENEWMVRLQESGVGAWHDPEMAVRRPQRETWSEFLKTFMAYGRGRSRQYLISRHWDWYRQAPLLALVSFAALFLTRPRLAIKMGIFAWLAYAFAVRVTPASTGQLSTPAALSGPVVPLFYAIGQFLGLLQGTRGRRSEEVRIYRWDASVSSLVSVSDPLPLSS